MTLEELLAVAEVVEKLTIRYRDQEAAHKAALTEIRASFNARTSADGELIEGRRMEIIRLNGANDRLNDLLRAERLAHRDEVAALQERLRASIARGDFAQMEVAALKSQTLEHPVKVGEWVRRLVPSSACDVGTVARVVYVDDNASEIEYDVERIGGQRGVWFAKNCEPCDPPEATAKIAPKVGDTVRLVTHPERAQVAGHLRTALQWPWIPRWGLVGQTGKVVKPRVDVDGSVAVALDDSTVFARWPIACLEVVAEATHDTEVGKAAAEAALTTEPVADEIKVGDVVEVVSSTHKIYTEPEDIGRRGIVTVIDGMRLSVSTVPGHKLPINGIVGKCDVRKVTT